MKNTHTVTVILILLYEIISVQAHLCDGKQSFIGQQSLYDNYTRIIDTKQCSSIRGARVLHDY